LKTISCVLHPASGEIWFEGERVDRLPSHEVVRRGICQAPEGRRIFPRMTVNDNLEMGAYARHDPAAVGEDFERVFALFPVLKSGTVVLEDEAPAQLGNDRVRKAYLGGE